MRMLQLPQACTLLICASLVGFIASFALPASFLWMQGIGSFILLAFIPLFLFIEMNFRVQPKAAAFASSLLCSFFSTWAIEFGFFFWGVNGIEAFLGLKSLDALLMTTFVLGVHSLAILPMFIFFISVRCLTDKLMPLAGACLCMPILEDLAPRLFHYTYGSFLSLSHSTSLLVSLGGSGVLTPLVFLVPLLLVKKRSAILVCALIAFMGFDLMSRLVLANQFEKLEVSFSSLTGLNEGKQTTREKEEIGINVLLVQPAIDLSEQILDAQGLSPVELSRFEENRALRNLKLLENLTGNGISSSHSRVDLIVWPETVINATFSLNPALKQDLQSVLDRFHAPVLLQYSDVKRKRNYSEQNIGHESNSTGILPIASLAQIWQGKDEVAKLSYQKSALMPFGEYLPWRPLWDLILPRRVLEDMPYEEEIPKLGNQEPLAFIQKGSGKVLQLAVGICYDGIFPDLARKQVNAGADVIVNLANLEWMGNAASENVYRSIVRLRALETGRPLIFVNNSGGTAAFDAKGSFLAPPLEHARAATSLVTLDLSKKYETGFNRYGYTLLYSLAIFGGFMILLPMVSFWQGYFDASWSKLRGVFKNKIAADH